MVLVDTSVLSLALRRREPSRLNEQERRVVAQFLELSDSREIVLLGVIRQELLSGIRHNEQFLRLRRILSGYEYIDPTLSDHDVAATCFNTCRAAGVAAGDIDMLITAVAIQHDLPIFTTDPDFRRYGKCLPIRLHLI